MSADLLDHATRFRRALEAYARSPEPYGDLRHFPHGACRDAVTFFAWYLLGLGRPSSEAVFGERRGRAHAWMVHEGLTVDLTADQFVDGQPPVVVAERYDWLDGWAVKERWTIDSGTGLAVAMFREYADAYRSVLWRVSTRSDGAPAKLS